MIPALEPVALQELRALGNPKVWVIDGHLDELLSLTPVRGEIQAEHRGSVLAVEAELNTIVTLSCDRCLGQFNHQLTTSPSELIWLGDQPPTEDQLQLSKDISEPEGLVETLDPRGNFDPQQWAFEQLNLQLPVVNDCGDNCPGAPKFNQEVVATIEHPIDPRWDALRRLNDP
jgi:uncharacterized protein